MPDADRAVIYAALILADSDVPLTADNVVRLTEAAGVEIEPIWACLICDALEGHDVMELLLTIGPSRMESKSDNLPAKAAVETLADSDSASVISDDVDPADLDLFGMFGD